MLFISVEDFFTQARNAPRLTREEEKQLTQEMGKNDEARNQLIRSYLPFVAANIRRLPKNLQNLQTLYTYLVALEKGVDSFNFQQDGERFSHHLSWRLRQCLVRCLVNQRNPNNF